MTGEQGPRGPLRETFRGQNFFITIGTTSSRFDHLDPASRVAIIDAAQSFHAYVEAVIGDQASLRESTGTLNALELLQAALTGTNNTLNRRLQLGQDIIDNRPPR